MTAQDLKNSILQLAVQGKLVPQNPDDEPASVLLEKIKAEKARLVKAGKVKQGKPLPEITEEEIPFEIPESWCWVRLGDLVQLINGDRGKNYPSKEKLTEKGIPFISAVNLDGGKVSKSKLLCMTDKQYDLLGSGKLKINDLIFCLRGSLGKNAICQIEQGAIASSLVILRRYSEELVSLNYFYYYINSPLLSLEISKYNNGTAQPNLSANNLASFLFPIPPLDEQQRIVEKIEELLPMIEVYGKAESELTAFNNRFPDDLKKSVLQYAVQGKLVEQNPNDEPASVLLEKIKAEKVRLVKEGKIKKEKPLPEIAEDEIPFEIPESWVWCRLGEIVSILGDGIHGTPSYTVSGEYFFINGNNLQNGQILMKDSTKRVSKSEYEKYRKPLDNSTMLISINGTLGNIAFYNNEKVMLGKSACYFNLLNNTNKKYLYYIFKSDYFLAYAVNAATGTIINNVSLQAMKQFIIPMPPFTEQQRIVEKVDELLQFCEMLN